MFPNSFQQFMFVEILANGIVNYFVTVVPEWMDLVCDANVTYSFVNSLRFFALECGFASIKRYFDRFQVLRTRLELLRNSKILYS